MDWEQFGEPPSVISGIVNKWDGEDEEEHVKDNWEDDEEEKKKEEQHQKKQSAQLKKTKSKLEEKIEEIERRELIRKSKLKQLDFGDEEDMKNMTVEQIHDEKLRRQKLQEESDYEVAKDMLGIDEVESFIDTINPQSKEEFLVFKDALCRKILLYKKSEHFPYFMEEFVRDLSASLSSTDLKKLKLNMDNMFTEKLRVEKTEKTKKSKGKGKAKLRIEGNDMMYDEFSAYTIDEYDDFM